MIGLKENELPRETGKVNIEFHKRKSGIPMKKIQSLIIILIISSTTLFAQSFSDQQKKEGYANRNDSTIFIFDSELYGKTNVDRVVVTGSFRGWDQNLTTAEFDLKKLTSTLWVLGFKNPSHERITPAAEFKFRINNGEWLNPPSQSPNQKGGNLVYLFGQKPNRLTAEINQNGTIWIILSGASVERSLLPQDYNLTDAKGNKIEIASVMPNTSERLLLTAKTKLDKRRVYYVEIPKLKLKTRVSFDGWFRELYSDKELGANISDDEKSTVFRIFSPRAEKVKLYLYTNENDKKPFKLLDMKSDENGVWEAEIKKNLHGVWYDFTVHGFDESGNHFYESNPVHISDPYARVVNDSFGKSRVWKRTIPAKPLKNGIPKMEDLIAYEVHVQDFTQQLPVEPNIKGKIPAMIKTGLKNSRGEKIGFDYLVDLGVNAIHLMPMQEYLHYPDDEWQEAYKDDRFMIEQGINLQNYDWGYRTTHAFAIETRYRKTGTEHGAQRDQFRDLVQAFHDKGIAVLVDFVFNHTGENMDGRKMWFNFNVLDKQYFYRTKNGEHIGEYGNETKSENRPMMQRWIIDQCKYFINEFGVDGFRIDLAGQTDQQTLLALKAAIGEDKIIYGEPWIGSNDPDYEDNPDWDWYKIDSPITYFQDDARTVFKGSSFFDPNGKENVRGFSGGDSSMRDKIKPALSNNWDEEQNPNKGINYLDIHDNWALADQLATREFDGRKGVDEGAVKIAAVLLYTSLGPIVNHGGTEMLRSKGLAPTIEHVKPTRNGKIYFNGRRDTNMHGKANEFVWENVGLRRGEKSNYFPNEKSDDDFKNMVEFWKGLNQFRLSETGKIFRTGERQPNNYYRFIEPENKNLLGYVVKEKVFVLVNSGSANDEFKNIVLPEGNWKMIANTEKIDLNGVDGEFAKLIGGNSYSISVEGSGLRIWVKQ